MADRIPARLTRAEGRRFGFTVGIAFVMVAVITWWRDHPGATQLLGIVGGMLVLAGLVAPRSLGPVQRAWMGLALAISKITTPIFMAIVYFVVIGPIGILMRVFDRNPMVHEAKGDSYWRVKEPAERRGTMTNQF